MAKGMSGMMKQVQKMQKKMMELQGELEQQRVEVVDPDDVEMLEDLILAAIHQAQQRAQEMMNKEMGQITGGVQIPGLTL